MNKEQLIVVTVVTKVKTGGYGYRKVVFMPKDESADMVYNNILMNENVHNIHKVKVIEVHAQQRIPSVAIYPLHPYIFKSESIQKLKDETY